MFNIIIYHPRNYIKMKLQVITDVNYVYRKAIMEQSSNINHNPKRVIREYGSTLYVGMTREKNGSRIKRVH